VKYPAPAPATTVTFSTTPEIPVAGMPPAPATANVLTELGTTWPRTKFTLDVNAAVPPEGKGQVSDGRCHAVRFTTTAENARCWHATANRRLRGLGLRHFNRVVKIGSVMTDHVIQHGVVFAGCRAFRR